jgi:hypothetical protein
MTALPHPNQSEAGYENRWFVYVTDDDGNPTGKPYDVACSAGSERAIEIIAKSKNATEGGE